MYRKKHGSETVRDIKAIHMEKKCVRAYWLAEQELAPKRELLVVVPLIIIFFDGTY